jgi:drug/metabolite transporter (DMT)-like permease
VLSFLFLGEQLTFVQAMGVLASLVGVVLVAQPPMLLGGHRNMDKSRAGSMAFLVAAAIGAASAITLVRKLSARESSLIMALWYAPLTACNSLRDSPPVFPYIMRLEIAPVAP